MSSGRGSVWKNSSKKKGFGLSIGSYDYRTDGDRFFVLTNNRTGKTRIYESPAAAIRDGWFIVLRGS